MKLLASLRIWIVIYPSITLLLYFFGHYLSALPLLLSTFILTVSLVPWIVFVGLPLLDTAIGKVFNKDKNGSH
jgi:antibiotic biosynthesis monooxygenase (ABM) superfamily enzyme